MGSREAANAIRPGTAASGCCCFPKSARTVARAIRPAWRAVRVRPSNRAISPANCASACAFIARCCVRWRPDDSISCTRASSVARSSPFSCSNRLRSLAASCFWRAFTCPDSAGLPPAISNRRSTSNTARCAFNLAICTCSTSRRCAVGPALSKVCWNTVTRSLPVLMSCSVEWMRSIFACSASPNDCRNAFGRRPASVTPRRSIPVRASASCSSGLGGAGRSSILIVAGVPRSVGDGRLRAGVGDICLPAQAAHSPTIFSVTGASSASRLAMMARSAGVANVKAAGFLTLSSILALTPRISCWVRSTAAGDSTEARASFTVYNA